MDDLIPSDLPTTIWGGFPSNIPPRRWKSLSFGKRGILFSPQSRRENVLPLTPFWESERLGTLPKHIQGGPWGGEVVHVKVILHDSRLGKAMFEGWISPISMFHPITRDLPLLHATRHVCSLSLAKRIPSVGLSSNSVCSTSVIFIYMQISPPHKSHLFPGVSYRGIGLMSFGTERYLAQYSRGISPE